MIVVPACGEGKRFKDAGYDLPKHLLPLDGVPMVERVVENVRRLDPLGDALIVTQDLVGKTKGAVDTLLRVEDKIRYGEPLVIANCDQLLGLGDVRLRGDGVIFTFPSASEAHSYVVTDPEDRIICIREKQVVSHRAVSGVYWFQSPALFLSACRKVLETQGDRELYLSAAIQVMLDKGMVLYAQDAPTTILGTPEDFQRYEVAVSLAS